MTGVMTIHHGQSRLPSLNIESIGSDTSDSVIVFPNESCSSAAS